MDLTTQTYCRIAKPEEMILKNLWSHRRQNGWVFAEIILITVLSFLFIDQIAVSTYDKYFCRPAGDFEREHLLVAQIGQTASSLPLRGEDGHLPEAEDDSRSEEHTSELQSR